MGDADYIYAFQQLVMPVAFEFNPDLVMSKWPLTHKTSISDSSSEVAAGFDAADGDQLGGCFVSPACYAHMTHMLKSLADGKLVACLEVCCHPLFLFSFIFSSHTEIRQGRIQPSLHSTLSFSYDSHTERRDASTSGRPHGYNERSGNSPNG